MHQFLFDTNFYRNSVFRKETSEINTELEKQKEIELKKGFKVVFPIVAAIELINHLNDNNSTSNECFKALKYLVKHCDNGDSRYCIAPTFYDLLTIYFYNTTSKSFIFNNNVLTLSREISSLENVNSLNEYREEINQIITIKEEERTEIIKSIENFYLTSLDNEGKVNWNIFEENPELKTEFNELVSNRDINKLTGLSLVKLAMNQTNSTHLNLSKDDFEKKFLNRDFKVAIDFFVKKIVEKIVSVEKKQYFYNPSTDPKKRWNSFYDMQFIFAVEFENLKGRNTTFVTKENKIRESFKNNGKDKLSICPNSYHNLLI
ncbi:hypothetical protein [Zunongwangia sp. H14]|uniref:hypothetical protein n=1 Tax=Zunongwangia sp. H14 TaxID=3240792 RepID=UPI003567223D